MICLGCGWHHVMPRLRSCQIHAALGPLPGGNLLNQRPWLPHEVGTLFEGFLRLSESFEKHWRVISFPNCYSTPLNEKSHHYHEEQPIFIHGALQ